MISSKNIIFTHKIKIFDFDVKKRYNIFFDVKTENFYFWQKKLFFLLHMLILTYKIDLLCFYYIL